MKEFAVEKSFGRPVFMRNPARGFYSLPYLRFGQPGNPEFLVHLKNNRRTTPLNVLNRAKAGLRLFAHQELIQIKNTLGGELCVCVVPRSKKEDYYCPAQRFFKQGLAEAVQAINGLENGLNYILRHTDTKTTHLSRCGQGGSGKPPYVGITKDTCSISEQVKGKRILLVDDIYTKTINIDEDAIQALRDAGASEVFFYAVAKTVHRSI